MQNFSEDKTSNIDILIPEMAKLGYKPKCLTVNDQAYVQFSKNKKIIWLTMASPLIAYPMTNATTRQISRNKMLGYEFMESLGIRVPRTKLHSANDDELVEMFAEQLVVKPLDGSISRGLTLDINNQTTLKSAIKTARGHSSDVLIQEQVSGEEVRFV